MCEDAITQKHLEHLRERAAIAACKYCSNGTHRTGDTHTIFGGIGVVPEIAWCEGRAIRNLQLIEPTT